MKSESECDDGSSMSVTSRAVKSVRGDEVAPDSDSDLDSPLEHDGRSVTERDDLLQRMAFHKSQGRARSRRKPCSQSMVDREFVFWTGCVSLLPSSSPVYLLQILLLTSMRTTASVLDS